MFPSQCKMGSDLILFWDQLLFQGIHSLLSSNNGLTHSEGELLSARNEVFNVPRSEDYLLKMTHRSCSDKRALLYDSDLTLQVLVLCSPEKTVC